MADYFDYSTHPTVLSRSDLSRTSREFYLLSTLQARLDSFARLETFFRKSGACYDPLRFHRFCSACSSHITDLTMYISTVRTASENSIDLSEIRAFIRSWGSTKKEHCLSLFGLELPSFGRDRESKNQFFMDNIRDSKMISSGRELGSRLELELTRSFVDNWFVCFGTLTVRPSSMEEVFSTGSSCFHNYMKRLERAVAIQVHGSYLKYESIKKAGDPCLTYFAVVEAGGTTGRLHLHILLFMKKLPKGCLDPNRGKKIPAYNEIKGFNRFWKYGFSSIRPVRFGNLDAFARSGWSWSVNEKTGEPMVCTDIGAMSGYLVKYILKSHAVVLGKDSSGDSFSAWRTRLSIKFGVRKLIQAMSELPDPELLSLVAIRSKSRSITDYKFKPLIKFSGVTIPYSLVRKLAIKEYSLRYQSSDTAGRILPEVCESNHLVSDFLKAETAEESVAIFSELMNQNVNFDGVDQLFMSACEFLNNYDKRSAFKVFKTGGSLVSRPPAPKV